MGIAQKSLVDTDQKLEERVTFMHERFGSAAIAEQYIEGRELYVSVLGNDRLRVLPIWELQFGGLPPGTIPIATEKMKFDIKYQERIGINQGPADDLAPELRNKIVKITKRICRTLELDGYCRVDFRLTAEGVPYFLEANPNPEIAAHEVFAQAALRDGIKYPELMRRMVALGISRANPKGLD